MARGSLPIKAEIGARLEEALVSEESEDNFAPKNHGYVLPLVVNVALLFVLAVLILFLFLFRSDPFVSTDLESNRFVTTEWRLLQEFQADLEFQLSLKNAEIARFQERLNALNERSDLLESAIESSIEAESDRLSEEREEVLTQQRREWEQMGLSTVEIASRLDRMRVEIESADERLLISFRSSVEADFSAEIQELFEERGTVRQLLAQAQIERAALADELERTRVALIQELENERAVFGENVALLSRELRDAEQLRIQDVAATGTLFDLYVSAIALIEAGEFDEARTLLDEVVAFVGSPQISRLETIRRRGNLDPVLVELLREIAARRESIATASPETAEDAALALLVAEQLVRDGNRAQAAGEIIAAEAFYLRALDLLPAARLASEQLDGLEAERLQNRVLPLLEEVAADTPEQRVERLREALLIVADPYNDVIETAFDGLEQLYLNREQALTNRLQRELVAFDAQLSSAQLALESSREALGEAEQRERRTLSAIDTIETTLNRQLGRTVSEDPEMDASVSFSVRVLQLIDALRQQTAAESSQESLRNVASSLSLLTGYLSGDEIDDLSATRDDILGRAEQDPLFRSIAVEVQELGVTGLGRAELPLGQQRLLGFVVSVDEATVEVEPIGLQEAMPGQVALFSANRGRVVEVRPDSVRIAIDTGDIESISFRDLVFLEISPR